ncbi:MAG: methyltransferase domain-containing protein [Thalassobaculum sp.]|uniref:methyltransferase domain-containing protein n=1 Tax=Thalassobaculum sp. TaxID=2022740 RepID=UPI0032ED969F
MQGNAGKIDVVSTTTAAETAALAERAAGPVLQVGARETVVDRGPRAWRQMLAGADFTGLDVADGDGVDVVADLCWPFERLDTALGGRRYGLILCQHVLEHVKRPFDAADNLAALLAPGGTLYVATPWVQAFHGYPDDYWRFSFRGLLELFPELRPVDMYYSATGSGLDAAYKITVDGRVDLDRTPFEIEGRLFELNFPQHDNLAMLRDQPEQPKLPLARRYLPAIFVNLVLQAA